MQQVESWLCFAELEVEDIIAMALGPFLFQPSQTALELSGRNL